MDKFRKITVILPEDLLNAACETTDAGVTATVKKGLELVASAKAYRRLLQYRGKIRFAPLNKIREDRK